MIFDACVGTLFNKFAWTISNSRVVQESVSILSLAMLVAVLIKLVLDKDDIDWLSILPQSFVATDGDKGNGDHGKDVPNRVRPVVPSRRTQRVKNDAAAK